MRLTLSRLIMQLSSILFATIFLSCSGDNGDKGCGHIKDYRTVTIGDQEWMADNLNCHTEGSKCYNNDKTNCDTYGRLYTYEMATTACPAGSHLPTRGEWYKLMDYIGKDSECSDCVGTLLKATNGWYDNGNGTDNYNFTALPGGACFPDGTGSEIGISGHWWIAITYEDLADFLNYGICMSYDSKSYCDVNSDKDMPIMLSVRCVKD